MEEPFQFYFWRCRCHRQELDNVTPTTQITWKKVKKPLSVCLHNTQLSKMYLNYIITNPSQDQHLVRFDVFTALLLGIQVFWNVKYCQVSSSQHFTHTTLPTTMYSLLQQMAVWLLTALYNHGPHSPMEVWIILGVQMPQLGFLKLRISKRFAVSCGLHLYQPWTKCSRRRLLSTVSVGLPFLQAHLHHNKASDTHGEKI